MVSCRWRRDWFQCMHLHNKMLSLTSAYIYTYWSRCAYANALYQNTRNLATHHLPEMPTHASVLSHAHIHINTHARTHNLLQHCCYIYKEVLFLSVSHSLTNGHTTYTPLHTVMWKGSIFHWPLCCQTVIFSQGQHSSAGGLGRERQLKSSNSMHIKTHRCTVHTHALTYTDYCRGNNGLRTE